MSSFQNWAGVITGNVMPFTPAGNIDWASLEHHVDRLSRAGLIGLLANAMMAEGLHLTVAERAAVLRFMIEKVGGRVPVIATIFGINTAEAAEEAYQAARAGAQAVLVFPHPAFGGAPLDPQIPAAYFQAIWERASLPMIVFRLPGATAPSFDYECLKRLSEVPGVAAVKDTVADSNFYAPGRGAEFLAADSPVKILIDDDAAMLRFLRLGAPGATSICATVDPERYVRLFESRNEQNADELDGKLRRFSAAVFHPPRRDFRARIKHALVLDGVLHDGGVRPPLPELGESERFAIAQALQASR